MPALGTHSAYGIRKFAISVIAAFFSFLSQAYTIYRTRPRIKPAFCSAVSRVIIKAITSLCSVVQVLRKPNLAADAGRFIDLPIAAVRHGTPGLRFGDLRPAGRATLQELATPEYKRITIIARTGHSILLIIAADFFRARLLGSAKATASLKLVSALMLTAVAVILSMPLFGL